jgi:CheY-like chemotaxis protein
MSLKRILVVDDNELNRRLVCAALARHGCESAEADTIAAAKQELSRAFPDALLLDVRLRAESGIDFVRELRADPTTARLLIIAVTAFAMTGDRESFLKEGFDGYISKPIGVRTLFAELEAIAASRT